MKRQEILSARRNELIQIIEQELPGAPPHSRAVAYRVLGQEYGPRFSPSDERTATSDRLAYGGYPEVAALGFALASQNHSSPEMEAEFLSGLSRLQNRSPRGLSFAGDDVALLGLAEGIAQINWEGLGNQYSASCRSWLLTLIDIEPRQGAWTARVKDLAGDLLDHRGRLSVRATQCGVDTRALEITLRDAWPEEFAEIPPPSVDDYEKLFTELIVDGPDPADLERALFRLRAIDLLVRQTSRSLFPRTDREALAIEQLDRIKDMLDRRAKRMTDCLLWVYVVFVVAIWIALIALTVVLTWAVMEPWLSYLGVPASVAPYIYFALTQKEWTPRAVYRQVTRRYAQKFYRQVGFDADAFDRLVR